MVCLPVRHLIGSGKDGHRNTADGLIKLTFSELIVLNSMKYKTHMKNLNVKKLWTIYESIYFALSTRIVLSTWAVLSTRLVMTTHSLLPKGYPISVQFWFATKMKISQKQPIQHRKGQGQINFDWKKTQSCKSLKMFY